MARVKLRASMTALSRRKGLLRLHYTYTGLKYRQCKNYDQTNYDHIPEQFSKYWRIRERNPCMKILNLKEPKTKDLALKQEHDKFKTASQTIVRMLPAQPTHCLFGPLVKHWENSLFLPLPLWKHFPYEYGTSDKIILLVLGFFPELFLGPQC